MVLYFAKLLVCKSRFETASSQEILDQFSGENRSNSLQKVMINHTIFWREKFNFYRNIFQSGQKQIFNFSFFSQEKFIIMRFLLFCLLVLLLQFWHSRFSFPSSSSRLVKWHCKRWLHEPSLQRRTNPIYFLQILFSAFSSLKVPNYWPLCIQNLQK